MSRLGPPVTRGELAADLSALGVQPGGVLMVHTRMSALGWVVGGSGTVVQALLDALGPGGTLMAYAGWEHDSYDIDAWPADRRAAYEADPPAYDPATSEGTRDNGRIPERIRTWPDAHRSRQPEANIVAIGARAAWIVADHPWDDPYGPGSPLAKLVEASGQVLMLGAPLETITLLHHAEATARVPHKRRVTYRMAILVDGRATWRTFHDIDTSNGAYPYDRIADTFSRVSGCTPETDSFEVIARTVLTAGIGTAGRTGAATSHLFPARELHAFAQAWMEDRFADPAGERKEPLPSSTGP